MNYIPHRSNRTPFVGVVVLALSLMWSACTDQTRTAAMASTKKDLTAGTQSILDFENALNDWTTPNLNVVLSENYNATSGVYSLAVTPNGWTELHSAQFNTLGSVKNTVSLDVLVPEATNWGDIKIVVQIPSKNIWWSELETKSLAELPVNQFATLEFPIPADTLTALLDVYEDARLIVILNAPVLSAPYLLDNIILTNDTVPTPTPTPTPGEVVEFSLNGPSTVPLLSIALNSHTTMKIGANVQVESPELDQSIISSLGETPFQMVEPDATLGTVISAGNAALGDRVHLQGSLIAPSSTLGQNVLIDGDTVTDAILEPYTEIPFKIEFPTTITETVWLEPTQTAVLTPGGYGMVRVGPNATLALESGTYYINTLNLEDSATLEPPPKLVLRQTDGPVIVYAKEIAGFHGTIHTQNGEDPNWVLVYTGQQDLHLDRNFNGAVVAPNALLSLHARTHKGAFYANAINVEAGAHVIHQVAHEILTGSVVDIGNCTQQIVVASNLQGKEREVAFQKAIIDYCIKGDIDGCYKTLVARANVDRATAALQFVNEEITGGQYLGLARDRSSKLRRARHDAAYAATLCNGVDVDGDWVTEPGDNCLSTQDLMPVDEFGCDATFPQTPDDDVVRDGLAEINLVFNAACADAEVPGLAVPGGFFWSNNQAKVFLVMSEITNQPPGCGLYYEFELQGETLDGQPAHLLMSFTTAERTENLVDLGRPVPRGLIQFVVTDADDGDKGKMATDIKPYKGMFRVRAFNYSGIRSPWSQWKTMSQRDCLSLGFRCANL